MKRTILAVILALAVASFAPPVRAQESTEQSKDQKQQKQKVIKDKKKDPDAIGERDVGKGLNWYSIEKEIAMGKAFAMEIERVAKIVDDPIIAEYVNRVGQNLVRNSDAQGAGDDQGDRHRRAQRDGAAGRVLLREHRIDHPGRERVRAGGRDGP